jgi:hypothetical protein
MGTLIRWPRFSVAIVGRAEPGMARSITPLLGEVFRARPEHTTCAPSTSTTSCRHREALRRALRGRLPASGNRCSHRAIEDWLIQCQSSNTTSTGRRRPRASNSWRMLKNTWWRSACASRNCNHPSSGSLICCAGMNLTHCEGHEPCKAQCPRSPPGWATCG